MKFAHVRHLLTAWALVLGASFSLPVAIPLETKAAAPTNGAEADWPMIGGTLAVQI
jgi:hypothetical protein